MAIVETFLEQNQQKPADIAALFVDFVAAAKTSLHLAVYDFRLSDGLAAPILNALRQRMAAGVDVRIVYDAGKPGVNFSQAGTDPAPPGTADFFKRLGGGLPCRPITGGDPRMPKLMHHKYAIRDGNTPTGALWTGSTNFTDDSWTLEENNIVRIDSGDLCRYYETDFTELWERKDIATTGAHDSGTVKVDGIDIGVAFSPGEGRAIDHDVAHRISTARRRLKICSMLITSGGILGALADALHKGQVGEFGGLYDRTQMESVFVQWRGSPAEWKIGLFEQVSAQLAGKRSTPYSPTAPHDFMHNKIVVADDTVITGSYNLSHSATENAENILLIQDRNLAERYNTYINRLAARYGKS